MFFLSKTPKKMLNTPTDTMSNYFKTIETVSSDPILLYQTRKTIKDNLRCLNNVQLESLNDELKQYKTRNGFDIIFSLIASIKVEKENILNDYQDNGNLEEINNFLEKVYASFIHYNDKTLYSRSKKWLNIISGDPSSVCIENNRTHDVVHYGDHVTRMRSLQNNCKEKLHKFIIPKWNSDQCLVKSLDSLPKISLNSVLDNERDIKIHRQTLLGFDYRYLECSDKGDSPIKIKLPVNLRDKLDKRGFNLDSHGEFQTDVNVLHMPIKLSTTVANILNKDGRCLKNGDSFDDCTLYIPDSIAKSKDILEMIYYTIKIENEIDPDRLKNNMILLTVRVDHLQPGETLGQGGWHVDGHQGAERLQMNGEKVAIDRVYAISNTLSTQSTDMRLDLDPVRERAIKDNLTLDQYNLQDIIQKSVIEAENQANLEGNTIITCAGDNNLVYANPYMIHQSRRNDTDIPIKRTFMRILFTVDERDRIGDTISPVIGPCYPFKIKTITDILQLPEDVYVKGKINTSYKL